MGHPMGVHDRTTATAGRDTAPTAREIPAADVLHAALDGVRLSGSLFLRAEYTEGWSYESPPPRELATMLRPGAERLVLFHIVASGACWISRAFKRALGSSPAHWRATSADRAV